MLQQTQVKTVIPYWERWMRELPTIEAAAKAPSEKIHKLWEGLGYYTRVRNLQKAAQQIVKSGNRKPETGIAKFPEKFEEVLALPGIGRYTAGAICSIAFNQPVPILDGNVIRVLTRIFGITENPKEKQTNQLLWQIAEQLVSHAKTQRRKEKKSPLCAFAPLRENNSCSFLNQSLMELGALVCTPRSPQCLICPVKKLCVAFKENRVEELPNLGKREAATARRFFAFVVEKKGLFLVRQRPAGIVNAHLWEFPNIEIVNGKSNPKLAAKDVLGVAPVQIKPLSTVKHSITRYRITLEAFHVRLKNPPPKSAGIWLTSEQLDSLAFSSAHKKLASFASNRILSGR
jgi:A/G-specific adenine glycosylase